MTDMLTQIDSPSHIIHLQYQFHNQALLGRLVPILTQAPLVTPIKLHARSTNPGKYLRIVSIARLCRDKDD